MNGDIWQVERFNQRKRTWEPFGRPSADFSAQYKKVSALHACGSMARLAKVTPKPAAAEIPENKAPIPETPEQLARRLGCVSKHPFDCEYCCERTCRAATDAIRRAQEYIENSARRSAKE